MPVMNHNWIITPPDQPQSIVTCTMYRYTQTVVKHFRYHLLYRPYSGYVARPSMSTAFEFTYCILTIIQQHVSFCYDIVQKINPSTTIAFLFSTNNNYVTPVLQRNNATRLENIMLLIIFHFR